FHVIQYRLSPLQQQRYSAHFIYFFFNHPATTEIYTLSLHDALPISRYLAKLRKERLATRATSRSPAGRERTMAKFCFAIWRRRTDRKSTRLNSSHLGISYAVFCLKKKKKKQTI